MEQTNLQISQILQPTLNVQIVQNNAPVVEAKIVIGGGGTVSVVFGDTMTGTGTPSDPVNVSNDILEQIQNNSETAEENSSQISNIQDIIPNTANPQNQLADQGFVNSSIQTATAYFRGDWATWADVPSDPSLYPVDATGNRTPTTNDYMVVITDEQTNGGTWRYKYTGLWSEQGKSGWQAEYQVNETPFTAAQNAALNSGVTAQAVADIATNKSNITALQNGKQDKLTAGDGITIDGNVISATGGGGGGGDYLPLSGGTLTGDLNFLTAKVSFVQRASDFNNKMGTLVILTSNSIGSMTETMAIDNAGIYPSKTNVYACGSRYYKWANVYTTKLNNGANLAVPTTGGTLARIEDIDAAVGDISTALTAILGE